MFFAEVWLDFKSWPSKGAWPRREGFSMICPRCSSEDVQIVYQQSGSRTASHGTGFGGKFNNAARATTAVATVGLSNLVWKKSKGTHKQKIKSCLLYTSDAADE